MSIFLRVGIFFLRIIYAFMKLLPVREKVTFLSRQSDEPSLDIRMLSEEIRRLHPDYKVVILCKTLKKDFPAALGYCFHMLRQLYHLATSRIVILDSYAIAVSVLRHKKSLLVIQMWHSVGTMKKFGYAILDKPEGSSSETARIMKMHANYDYILCASEAYRAHLAEGFNCPPEKIVIYPLPRVEALKSKVYAEDARQRIYDRYPQLKEKETILYVPTFRKGENAEFAAAAAALADAVDYSRYNLVIKAHPLSEFTFGHPHAVTDSCFSSFDMLFAADHVISDFSCIIYEAAILGLPLYFYVYDYEHYLSVRDIQLDYLKEMPGPVCRTASETVQAVSDGACEPDRVRAFAEKYVSLGRSHETRDIVEFIFDNRKPV